MNKLKRFTLLLATVFLSANVFAQDKPEMADAMRANGKIYVVVAVCLIILAGLFLFMLRLDKKITRLEKNTNS